MFCLLLQAQLLLYVPPDLINRNSTFCWHTCGLKYLEIWQVLRAQEKNFEVLRIRNCSNTMRHREVPIRLIFSAASLYMLVIPDYISKSIRSGDARFPLRLVSVCLSVVCFTSTYVFLSRANGVLCWWPCFLPIRAVWGEDTSTLSFRFTVPLRAVSSSNLRHHTPRRMTFPSARSVAVAP